MAEHANGGRPGTIHIPAGSGSRVYLFGDTYTVKVTGDDTGGAFGFVEASVPPDGGPRPHVHTDEHESFYILSGELEIQHGAAGSAVTVGTGDFVFIPKGTVHRFKNRSAHTTRMVFWYTPAGFEKFFLEAGVRAEPGAGAPDLPEPGREQLAEIARMAMARGWQPGPGALDALRADSGGQQSSAEG